MRLLSRYGRRKGYSFRPLIEALENRLVMSADAVVQWNNIALDAIRTEKTAPPIAARDLAILHTAIYDSVNAIDRTHAFYFAGDADVVAPADTSLEAAVAAAAYQTLASLFPAEETSFLAKYQASLAEVADGPAEDLGVAVGETVAARILALRSTDGSTAVVAYTPGTDPGDWQLTPRPNPAGGELPGLPALLPQWPNVTPFAMTSGDQFRPDGIPDLTSQEYADALNEVKDLGSKTSTTRTQDQTDIALYWANGAGTATPPGHLNVLAQTIAEAQGNTLTQNARLFALLNIALADSAIACWDAKYAFSFWRPITAIRAADTDGNDATVADPAWKPLIVTPNFPTYSSGHSTFSGAAATVLAEFFGTDDIAFTLKSENPSVSDRSFTSFSQAAEESAVSRMYGGIHFSFDNNDGLSAGNSLGVFVSENFLQEKSLPARAGILDGTLVVVGTAGNDRITLNRNHQDVIVIANRHVLGTFNVNTFNVITISAGNGNDTVRVALSITVNAEIHGGSGDDNIFGGSGNDQLFGEGGRDALFGRWGDDLLDGGSGDDLLVGGHDTDILIGGPGRNRLRR